jgi:hypothetical protein
MHYSKVVSTTKNDTLNSIFLKDSKVKFGNAYFRRKKKLMGCPAFYFHKNKQYQSN